MDAADVLAALVPSWSAAVVLASYLVYLAAAGLFSLLLLLGLSALGVYMDWMTPIVVADRGLELLSTTFIFSVIVGATSYLDILMTVHFN
ncbi:sterol C-14 reductase [Hordeum vulgare]|nr:sterol C-14 reductase [Hordeum vulgare]